MDLRILKLSVPFDSIREDYLFAHQQKHQCAICGKFEWRGIEVVEK